MINAIFLLMMIVTGFGIMFGWLKPERLYQFLIWLLVAPILLCAVFNGLAEAYLNMPQWGQILSFMLLPFAFSILLRLLLPKVKWLHALQSAVFETLVFALAFPFRLAWRVTAFIFERERRRTKLDPYRAAVGSPPPLAMDNRRETSRQTPR